MEEQLFRQRFGFIVIYFQFYLLLQLLENFKPNFPGCRRLSTVSMLDHCLVVMYVFLKFKLYFQMSNLRHLR